MEQYLELEQLGILKATRLPTEFAWINDELKHFLLALHFAGEEGIHKRQVQDFKKKNSAALFDIEVRNMVEWLNDKAGRPVALALTWKGEEVTNLLLSIAKNESQKTARLAAQSAKQPVVDTSAT